MKRIILVFVLSVKMFLAYSQVPAAFSYQAVVRNSSGEVISNQMVSFRISILTGSETGSVIYSETHLVTTNNFGLANLTIGSGDNQTGIFSPGGWGMDAHFIKIEVDPAGGDSFLHLSTTQLLSVPYAFHAQTVEIDNVDDADADPSNELQTLSLEGNDLRLSDGGLVNLPEVESIWGKNDTSIYFNTGNVGIGTKNNILNRLAISGEYGIDVNVIKRGIKIISEEGSGMVIHSPSVGISVNSDFERAIMSSTSSSKSNASALFGYSNWSNGIMGCTMSGIAGVIGLNEGKLSGSPDVYYGVVGTKGYGYYFNESDLSTFGYLYSGEEDEIGAGGFHKNGHFGYLGTSEVGVYGENSSGNYGELGHATDGVYGRSSSNNGSAIAGVHTGSGNGVYGRHNPSGNLGALGRVESGVYGKHFSGNYGYIGTDNSGVYGKNSNGKYGKLGDEDSGVFGRNSSEQYTGRLGRDNGGVSGYNTEGPIGYLATFRSGVYGTNSQGGLWAGEFNGDVHISGNLVVLGYLNKYGGGFKIDHPLDSANKYLIHSFVESPDMKNIYDGVIMLDENGEGEVLLPEWFEALNKDFRYQLTCIGGFGNVYILKEIQNNQFKIAGGTNGLKVSWLVTGNRKDAYAKMNPILVEEEKKDDEKGKYLHPEAFGLPEEMGIGYEEEQNMAEDLTTENK